MAGPLCTALFFARRRAKWQSGPALFGVMTASWSILAAVVADQSFLTEDRILEAFNRLDVDHSGELSYDDVKEMGIHEVGPRRKVYRAIAQWRDERDAKKAEAIRGRMQVAEAARPENPGSPDVGDRLRALVREVSSLK